MYFRESQHSLCNIFNKMTSWEVYLFFLKKDQDKVSVKDVLTNLARYTHYSGTKLYNLYSCLWGSVGSILTLIILFSSESLWTWSPSSTSGPSPLPFLRGSSPPAQRRLIFQNHLVVQRLCFIFKAQLSLTQMGEVSCLKLDRGFPPRTKI